MSTEESNPRFRRCVATGVAVLGILACSAGVSAKEPPSIINIDTGEVMGTVEAVPTDGPVLTIRSIQSSSNVASAMGPEVTIYEVPVQATEFAVYSSFRATTGASFPGTIMFDNMGLGAGFAPGGEISSYELRLFRSSLDFQPGLADLHVALWDGDPFCGMDTPGGGFACAIIAGSEADIVGIPQNTRFVASVTLPKGVVTGATNTENRIWMAISSSVTGNPSPCRLGWIIGAVKPRVGNDLPFNGYGLQSDKDGLVNGGTCCVDGLGCNTAGPICAFCADMVTPCVIDDDCPVFGGPCWNGAEDGTDAPNSRGWCSDDFAESAGFFAFNGECDGGSNDFCANFVASIFTPAKVTISWVPIGNAPDGSLDPGASIDGTEITLKSADTTVFLEIRFSDWDPDNIGTKLKAAIVTLDTSGYTAGSSGTLARKVVDCHGLCDGGVNDGAICAAYNDCNACSGGANNGMTCVDDDGCPDGSCVQWPCMTDGNPEGDEACRVAFGGVCGGLTFTPGAPCVTDADCPDISPPNFVGKCDGPRCSSPVGLKEACEAGFILVNRGNYVFLPAGGFIAGVDLATPDSRFFGFVSRFGSPVSAPDPFPPDGQYAGTLVLDVPADARGTFTIGMHPIPSTVLVAEDNSFIPLVALIPARITVEFGRCCYTEGDEILCVDNLPPADCDELAEPRLFTLGASCGGLAASCDCNGNSVPDPIDITNGDSADCNANDVLDECEAVCLGAERPQGDPGVTAKNRYLSFKAVDSGCFTAIRVIPVDLPPGFEAFEGVPMWATNLQSVCENPGQTFQRPCGPATGLASREMWTATLGCGPEYRDWGAVGLVHVFDETIVPGGSYAIQAVNISCDTFVEGSFSAPLDVSTSVWGDLAGPFDRSTGRWLPPDGSVDVPFDAVALLDKFANRVGAPIKVRADLQPALPDMIVDIVDLVWVLQAFRGFAYPFTIDRSPCGE